MSTYVIGDVQGCAHTLYALLREINFAKTDKLIFAGDIVNRGPRSLETLEFIISLGAKAQVVLGNHDLYLLMIACGGRTIRAKDTFAEVLAAAEAEEILWWLSRQPLIIREGDFTVVHAGLLPQWTIAQAWALGQRFSQQLAALWQPANLQPARDFFKAIWDNSPNYWSEDLTAIEKYRVTVNAMTRIRAVDKKGRMNFDEKGEIADLPEGIYPWFEIKNRRSRKQQIVCGHWSALGLMLSEDVSHIDTGCVWRRKLTAMRLPDRQIFQVGFCD